MKFILLFIFLSSFCFGKVTKVLSSKGVIWGMDFVNQSMIFTKRSGELFLYNFETKKTKKLPVNLPKLVVMGQGGLLDVLVDKDFSKNNFIYLTYSKKIGSKFTVAVLKAKLIDSEIKNTKDIFIAKTDSKKSIHFGSRIRQDKNGDLFVSIGDRGIREAAQNLQNHHGSIIKIDRNGNPAKGSPFIKNALPEIYSYGHRNPQGMHITDSGELYINEHGPRGGDEINIIKKGVNYGWPEISYGKEYWGPISVGDETKEGMEQPIYYYVPSIAPSGLIKYSGKLYKSWKDSFFSGALKLKHINRLYRDKKKFKEERLEKSLDKRIRSIKENLSGEIFFSTDNGDIYKLLPN